MIFLLPSLRRRLDRFCRDTTGGSVIELAFVLPIIALLGVGAFDFGSALTEGNRVEGAARAGAQYARVNSAVEDHAGIEAAAWAEAGDTSLVVTPVSLQRQ